MHIHCTITFSDREKSIAATADARVHEALSAMGWNKDESGSFTCALPAGPGAVDAPSIALHKMLARLAPAPTANLPEARRSFPVSVVCAYRERDIFRERLTLNVGDDGCPTLESGANPTPFFSDLLRLRDKVLSVIQAAHRDG